MRSHGGGWHANTAKMCFGLSIIYYLTKDKYDIELRYRRGEDTYEQHRE